VNPGFTDIELDAVRHEYPNARLLATVSAHSVPEYGDGNPALDSQRTMLGDHIATLNGWDRFQARDSDPGKMLNFSTVAAEAFADWIGMWLSPEEGFDGVYIDELWGDDLPAEMTRNFTWRQDRLRPRWPGYRDTLLRILAGEYPGLSICNTAGHIPTTGAYVALATGMCIEAAHSPRIIRLAKYQAAARAGMTENIDWFGGLSLEGVVIPGDRLG
jgi:hypothetical protein